MTLELPQPVTERVRILCIEDRFPAFIRLNLHGMPTEWGGALDHYGLGSLGRDLSAVRQIDMLEGVLPLKGQSLSLPFVRFESGISADVHLFPADDGEWIVFLDSTCEARRLFEIQQNSNEIALLREREARMLEDTRTSHNHLLSIFDQLQLITAIVQADGRVAFLSYAGRAVFLGDRASAVGAQWEEVFPFDREDQAAIRQAMSLPAEKRRKRRVHSDVPGGRVCWFEVDVRDDPRDPGRRILFLYDVSEVHDLRQMLQEKAQFHDMVGKSRAMEQVFQLIRDVSLYDSTVLIEGETGTGKELVARAIHASSARRGGPFIVMNCAGLSDTLINSQLFGHKKGAFTDAIRDQVGLFEAADGGTIVLDEIGDIPTNTQTRILRVLEQREIVRIGETHPRAINIRILAATNKDLAEEVKKGAFRLDLLYRIRVARIRLPPLRERREDIPLLTGTYLSAFRAATGKPVERVDEDVMRTFMTYRWPGNVRELRNTVEFGVIRCRGGVIRLDDLPPELTDAGLDVAAPRSYEVDEEKERIRKALETTGGRREEAARLLGMSRATLYRRMRTCFPASGARG